SRGLAARRLLRLLIALFAQQRFAAEPDLVSFDGQDLYQHLVAFLQRVADRADALLRDFADVQKAVGSGKDFDEGAKLGDADYFAKIGLADLRRSRDVADFLQGRLGGWAVGSENVHLAVVHHVDFHPGLFDDRADLLAARPDEVADLVGGNGKHEQVRGVV